MKIVVASCHFSPGYIGHMKAWYRLSDNCGYGTRLFVDKKYVPYFEKSEYTYFTEISELEEYYPDIVVVQNTGFENLSLFKWCGRKNIKIFYLLHEPYMGLKELMKDGSYAWKQFVATLLNFWLCHKSQRVVVCSRYANQNCKKYMKWIENKKVLLPLLFLDEYRDVDNSQREYFSMIGTYAESHGSDIFIKYIRDAYKQGSRQKYQIATRSNIEDMLADPVYKQMQDEGLLQVQQGRPLTEEEMSAAYRRSLATWNGYRRSTQSGVLPNSFMQGTPVVASQLESFKEFILPGKTGVYLKDFSTDAITDAVEVVRMTGEMNGFCRDFFKDRFYYGSQIESFKRIVRESTAE